MNKFIWLSVLLCFKSFGMETNTVFPIDDGWLVSQNAKGEIKFNRDRVEAAKEMKECLPADQFPEGNWGEVANGFQLSLCFETNTFEPHVPIIATIILRNVTNSTLKYESAGVMGRTSPISVVVTKTAGENASLKSDEITVISLREVKLFPGTQQKFHEQIEKIYDLPTNCVVNAYAELELGHARKIRVHSATVSLTLR